MKETQTAPQPSTAARQDGSAAVALPAPGASLLLQPKLLVGHPDDPLEHEADRAADRVVSLWQGGGFRHPSGDAPTPSGVPLIQRRATSPAAGAVQASPQVTQQIQSAQGGGQALPATLQPSLEAAFGMDFSGVRLHTDARADALNRDLQARAFTTGRDIFFREGAYQPGTAEGVRLLGHELGHVGQQGGDMIRRTRSSTSEQSTLREERETSTLRESVNYVFIFPTESDDYDISAERFFEVYYPNHIMVTEFSNFEDMFDRLYADMHRMQLARRNVSLGELVIVTHANALGGLQIPLARGDGSGRTLNPWNLRELQVEFSDLSNAAYRRRRRFHDRRAEVVEDFITPNTNIVIRGCNFGQSQEGMDALRSFFGGHVFVWAPRVYQGYEVAQIGGQNSHVGSVEEAFDILQSQGLIPESVGLDAESKRAYMSETFGINGTSTIPLHHFVLDAQSAEAMRQLDRIRLSQSEQAQQYIERSGTTIPSLNEYWGLSAVSPFGEDADLDSLSLEELEMQARELNQNYQPSNAPMLLRLRRAWERHPQQLDLLLESSDNDPLAGFPPTSIFGDPDMLALDAAQYQSEEIEDTFETRRLIFERPSELLREELSQFDSVASPDSISENTAELVDQVETTIDIPHDRHSRLSERERYLASMDFSKRRLPIIDIDEDVSIEEVLVLLQTDIGLLHLIGITPDESWRSSDYMTLLSLGISGFTGIPEVFALELFMGVSSFTWGVVGLAAPLLDTVGFFVTLSEVSEVQQNAAEVLGIQIGLQSMILDAFADRIFDSSRWYRDNQDNPEFISQSTFRYPLSEDGFIQAIQSGLFSVERDAVSMVIAGERQVRRHLINLGMPDSQVRRLMAQYQGRIRRIMAGTLYRRGISALETRRHELNRSTDQ